MTEHEKQGENKYSIPLRKIPKITWYSNLKSPYQSKRELKNYFKGGLILIFLMTLIFGILYWVVNTYLK